MVVLYSIWRSCYTYTSVCGIDNTERPFPCIQHEANCNSFHSYASIFYRQ